MASLSMPAFAQEPELVPPAPIPSPPPPMVVAPSGPIAAPMLGSAQVARILEGYGMTLMGPPRRQGDVYVADAFDRGGYRVEVMVDGANGDVLDTTIVSLPGRAAPEAGPPVYGGRRFADDEREWPRQRLASRDYDSRLPAPRVITAPRVVPQPPVRPRPVEAAPAALQPAQTVVQQQPAPTVVQEQPAPTVVEQHQSVDIPPPDVPPVATPQF